MQSRDLRCPLRGAQVTASAESWADDQDNEHVHSRQGRPYNARGSGEMRRAVLCARGRCVRACCCCWLGAGCFSRPVLLVQPHALHVGLLSPARPHDKLLCAGGGRDSHTSPRTHRAVMRVAVLLASKRAAAGRAARAAQSFIQSMIPRRSALIHSAGRARFGRSTALGNTYVHTHALVALLSPGRALITISACTESAARRPATYTYVEAQCCSVHIK